MTLQYDEIIVKKKRILFGGQLEVPEVGICQIIGKNGSGKSLLLHNLFYHYKKLYNVKLVNQSNYSILRNCSVLDNIVMSKADDKKQEVCKFMEHLEIQDVLNRDARTLSGGEKRLISILRALVSDADIIFLDEPTNDLDYQMVNKLIHILENYKDEKLIVIVSHDDRIDEVSDIIYKIVDGKLENIKTHMKFIEKHSAKKIYKIDKEFICSIVKRNYLMYFVLFLFLLGTLFCIFYMERIKIDEYPQSMEGQIDIYIPLSDSASSYSMQGAIPISSLLYINSDMTISDYMNYIETTNHESLLAINYGLQLESTKDYTVYNMEYYDSDEHQHFYTLDTYVEDIYEEDSEVVGIDITNLFDYDYAEGYEEYKSFNEYEFRKCENKLSHSGKELEVLHIIVVLRNGYSFWDFIETEECHNLMGGNFFVRSNETIAVTSQANTIFALKRAGGMFLAIVILSFVLITFLCLVIILIMKSNFLIFRDYGVTQKDLYEIVTKRYNNKWVCIIYIGILCFSIITLSNKVRTLLSLNNLIITVLFSIMEFAMIRWNKWMLGKGIAKIYDWRYRC